MRRLPHWRQFGATYFVTFRLNDSLPQGKLRELNGIRNEWERTHPPPHSYHALQELTKLIVFKQERWLDEGYGSCVLAQPNLAAIIIESMHYFDGQRYELNSYVVMPNHIHVIVRPANATAHSLEAILKSWKQFSSVLVQRDVEFEAARVSEW